MEEGWAQQKQELLDYRLVIEKILDEEGWTLTGTSFYGCRIEWTLGSRTIFTHCPITTACLVNCEFRISLHAVNELGQFTYEPQYFNNGGEDYRFFWREATGEPKEKVQFYPNLEEWESAMKSWIRGDAPLCR